MYSSQLIIKRKGHKEYFDSRKLYASIYAACMVLRMHNEEIELIADMVTADIEKIVLEKETITSQQLRELTTKELEKYQPDVAYMYQNHRDII